MLSNQDLPIIAKKAPKNAPTVFITKSVNSKKPTRKISWKHSMQSDKQKAAKVTSPIRRQEPVRFNVARNSARKNPNGTKAAMFAIISKCIRPLFWNRRENSSVRLYPEECGVIPRYRIKTVVTSKNRPMKTVRHKAIAPYTEHFFRIRGITVNVNDTTPITTQCPQGIWERMPRAYSCNADPVISINYIPGLRITNSIAPSGNALRPEQTRARYPPPPAPGIFQARTPGIAEYLSMYSCTPG